MSRTFIRQSDQIANSDTYNDNLAGTLNEATYQDAVSDLETDLNYLRTQINRILNVNGADADSVGSGRWFNGILAPTVFTGDGLGKRRGISTLNNDLHDLERKRVLTSFVSLQNVTVPAAQNWVVLSDSQIPTPGGVKSVAVGTPNVNTGSVAAYVSSFNAHSLDQVNGATEISPKNLVVIVSGSNRDPMLSGSNIIYGLLQSEVNTPAFTANDSDKQLQISFVTVNAAGADLVACAPAAIAGQTINFISPARKALKDLDEQDFLRGAEIDVPSTSASSRKNAYDNQGEAVVSLGNNATLSIGSGYSWEIEDNDNATLFKITEDSTGGNSTVLIDAATDLFQVKAASNKFDKGIVVQDENANKIKLGVTTGKIETEAGNDLFLLGGREMFFDDGNQATSTWTEASGIKLSDTALEWTNFSGSFGEVSLLKAIYQSKRRDKVYAYVQSNVPAESAVSGSRPGFTGANLSSVLPYMNSGSFTTDYDVYLNGQLLQGGIGAAAGNDYFRETNDDAHVLRFEFGLKTGDVICVVPYVRD